jgi:Raf kinase inhibitor-like YbhB/YbcL family protein
MRTTLTTVSAALILAAAGTASAAPFALTSPEFKNNGALTDKHEYNSFGCTGQNISPALEWKNPPKDTKSFVLMVHDPDAPTGSGFWHWIVYNIPADATSIPAGAGDAKGTGLPKGAVQGHTDFGTAMYGGPCPPPGSGKHHYNFMLYALKVDKIEIPPGATAAIVGFNANMNAIGKPAKLTGTFERKKEKEPAAAKEAPATKPAAPAAKEAPAAKPTTAAAPAPKPAEPAKK